MGSRVQGCQSERNIRKCGSLPALPPPTHTLGEDRRELKETIPQATPVHQAKSSWTWPCGRMATTGHRLQAPMGGCPSPGIPAAGQCGFSCLGPWAFIRKTFPGGTVMRLLPEPGAVPVPCKPAQGGPYQARRVVQGRRHIEDPGQFHFLMEKFPDNLVLDLLTNFHPRRAVLERPWPLAQVRSLPVECVTAEPIKEISSGFAETTDPNCRSRWRPVQRRQL